MGRPEIALEEIAAGSGDRIALFVLVKTAAALGHAVHPSIIRTERSGSLSLSIE